MKLFTTSKPKETAQNAPPFPGVLQALDGSAAIVDPLHFDSDDSPNKADTQRYQRINQTIVSIDGTPFFKVPLPPSSARRGFPRSPSSR